MSGNVYRYLDTLITAGSFSKAARVLQISQPSISQFVHRLETEVGTELVDRTAKPLRLTYAGECFMRTEREIEQLRSMRSRLIADIDEGVRGHVTIGSSHYRSTFFLAEVLPIFRREYPGVTVSLAEGTTKELEDFAAQQFAGTNARTADDVLQRRLRIGELDSARAEQLRPVVQAQIDALKAQEAAAG